MLRIITIGSGSSGNCYIIECIMEDGSTEKLILEAGTPFITVEKALLFDLSNVVGCCITHEHGDHAAYVKDFIKSRILVYATQGTLDALRQQRGCIPLKTRSVANIGSFRVMPFETEHDAAEPCGYIIDCSDGNRIVFATDTYYLKFKFPNVTVFMMECNYDYDILQRNIKDGSVHPSVAERVTKSHMSIAQCLEMMHANDLSKVKAIMLIHLSGSNSQSDVFQQKIARTTGKAVYIAQKDKNVTIF